MSDFSEQSVENVVLLIRQPCPNGATLWQNCNPGRLLIAVLVRAPPLCQEYPLIVAQGPHKKHDSALIWHGTANGAAHVGHALYLLESCNGGDSERSALVSGSGETCAFCLIMVPVEESGELAQICSRGLVHNLWCAVSVNSAWPSRRRDRARTG